MSREILSLIFDIRGFRHSKTSNSINTFDTIFSLVNSVIAVLVNPYIIVLVIFVFILANKSIT